MANEAIGKLSDSELEAVSGGSTREYRAAWDVVNGLYGAGGDCRKLLRQNGFDPDIVLYLADGIGRGYVAVARDIISNKYGVDQQRRINLINAGFDPDMAQAIVNGMLLTS